MLEFGDRYRVVPKLGQLGTVLHELLTGEPLLGYEPLGGGASADDGGDGDR